MGRDQLGTSGSKSLDIKLFSKSLDSFPSCKIGNIFNNWLMLPDSSVGKESACNAGDPGLIPGLGRSAEEGTTPVFLGFPCGSAGKESACNVGDLSSVPGLGRSPGEGKGYPLQYSGLENSMDCIVHGITKSQTRLSYFYFHFLKNIFKMCSLPVASLF